MTEQLEFDLFENKTYEQEQFLPGEYAVVSEICKDGYYLWERCYVHEVLPDGYHVEICEGLTWGQPWYKDGTMITVSKSGLSRYDADTHYRTGAHWLPSVDWLVRHPGIHYDSHSVLV